MTRVEHLPAANTLVVAHKLDAVGWGLFFVWVGVFSALRRQSA